MTHTLEFCLAGLFTSKKKPKKKNNSKMSSDMRSVPDIKIVSECAGA